MKHLYAVTPPRRRVFDLTYDTLPGCWQLKEGRIIVQLYPRMSKQQAISSARRFCRKLYRKGHLCQLKIHNLNGRIARNGEHTYGNDPERHVG